MYRFFLICIMLFSIEAFGQSEGTLLIDSLYKKLSAAQNDTDKVKLLDLIAYHYYTSDPDSGIKYAFKALSLAEDIDWKKGQALANADLGCNYVSKSEFAKALYHDTQAMKLYASLGSSNDIATMLGNISIIYEMQSDYPRALEYDFKALKIKEGNGDKKKAAYILENIGTLYMEKMDYAEAIKYYKQALEEFSRSGNKQDIARCYGNMGVVLDAQGKYEEALRYHFKALDKKMKFGDKRMIQISLSDIGNVYFHQKKFAEALKYQHKALDISKALDNKNAIAVCLGNIGETYFTMANTGDTPKDLSKGDKKNLTGAIQYLDQSVVLCKSLNYYAPMLEFLSYLSKAYKAAGQFQKAYEKYEQYTTINDSIFSQQNKAKLSSLEFQRRLDLKDREIIIQNEKIKIADLKARNTRYERIIVSAAVLLFVLIIVPLFIQLRKRVRKQKDVLDDISQIQSHQIRGPVARILGLVQLYNMQDPSDPMNAELIQHLQTATFELDAVVKKVITTADLQET